MIKEECRVKLRRELHGRTGKDQNPVEIQNHRRELKKWCKNPSEEKKEEVKRRCIGVTRSIRSMDEIVRYKELGLFRIEWSQLESHRNISGVSKPWFKRFAIAMSDIIADYWIQCFDKQ